MRLDMHLVAAMQTHSAPVHKITIIPRTSGALGYTMQVEAGRHIPDDQRKNWRTRLQPLPADVLLKKLIFRQHHNRRVQ